MNDHILISFGFMLGAVFALVGIETQWYSTFSTEMLSFGGAIIGASITVLGALWLTSNEAKDKRRRQQLGARAILSSDLSFMCDYVDNSAAAAMRADAVNDGSVEREEVQCPKLDLDILMRLQRLVELLDGEDSSQVVDLMHCHQVQRARLSDVLMNLNDPTRRRDVHLIRTKNNFEHTLQATVELHLRAQAMFAFARGELDKIGLPPFSEDRVHNSMSLLNVNEWLSPPEYDHIVSLMTNLDSAGRWRRNK